VRNAPGGVGHVTGVVQRTNREPQNRYAGTLRLAVEPTPASAIPWWPCCSPAFFCASRCRPVSGAASPWWSPASRS